MNKICIVCGSDKNYMARGMCSVCYSKWHYENYTKQKRQTEEGKQKQKESNHRFYKEHKDELKAKVKEYYAGYVADNREEYRAKKREYYSKNKEAKRQKQREHYHKNKKPLTRSKNPLANVYANWRRRLRECFERKGMRKNGRTAEILGCDFEFLISHIEKQFVAGMTWKNKGDWHIDHIIPMALAQNEAEMIKLCHYSNLRPMWARDNIVKGSRIYDKELAERILGRPIHDTEPPQNNL